MVTIPVLVTKEKDGFRALNTIMNISSKGATVDEAIKNVRDFTQKKMAEFNMQIAEVTL